MSPSEQAIPKTFQPMHQRIVRKVKFLKFKKHPLKFIDQCVGWKADLLVTDATGKPMGRVYLDKNFERSMEGTRFFITFMQDFYADAQAKEALTNEGRPISLEEYAEIVTSTSPVLTKEHTKCLPDAPQNEVQTGTVGHVMEPPTKEELARMLPPEWSEYNGDVVPTPLPHGEGQEDHQGEEPAAADECNEAVA